VSSAASLLRQRGYAATSTTDVLRAAGVTTGSLYHHFPGGKEDLAIAALNASANTVHDALALALSDAPTTAAALTQWLARLATMLHADIRDGCPIAPTALEAAHASDRLRTTAANAFNRWITTISDSLVAEGRPSHQARTTAVAVLALVEGALLLSRTAGNNEALSAAAEQIETLTTRS
jgi:TetR/AcrR family transcriptional repressor of lmrAB and yxaGH operons